MYHRHLRKRTFCTTPFYSDGHVFSQFIYSWEWLQIITMHQKRNGISLSFLLYLRRGIWMCSYDICIPQLRFAGKAKTRDTTVAQPLPNRAIPSSLGRMSSEIPWRRFRILYSFRLKEVMKIVTLNGGFLTIQRYFEAFNKDYAC